MATMTAEQLFRNPERYGIIALNNTSEDTRAR